jgi:hypothetical protein
MIPAATLIIALLGAGHVGGPDAHDYARRALLGSLSTGTVTGTDRTSQASHDPSAASLGPTNAALELTMLLLLGSSLAGAGLAMRRRRARRAEAAALASSGDRTVSAGSRGSSARR